MAALGVLAKAFEELPILERFEPEATRDRARSRELTPEASWTRLTMVDESSPVGDRTSLGDRTSFGDRTSRGLEPHTSRRTREDSSLSAGGPEDGGATGAMLPAHLLVGRPPPEEQIFGMPSAERMLDALDGAVMGVPDGSRAVVGSPPALQRASDEAVCHFARMVIELRLVWSAAVSKIWQTHRASTSSSIPSISSLGAPLAGSPSPFGQRGGGLAGAPLAATRSHATPFPAPGGGGGGGGDAAVPNAVLHRAVLALAQHAAARRTASSLATSRRLRINTPAPIRSAVPAL